MLIAYTKDKFIEKTRPKKDPFRIPNLKTAKEIEEDELIDGLME